MNNKVPFLTGLLGGLLALGVAASIGAVWSNAGYEGPAGTSGIITNATSADQIDDYMRDGRQEVRYRAEVEHFWGDGEILADDNGLHRLGSARCYMSNTAPTVLSDSHTGIPGAGASIADYDNSTGASFSGEVDLDDSATNSAGGIEDDVGHGRCWVDLDGPDNSAGTLDDNKLYTYVGVAGAAGCPGGGAASDCWMAVDAAARPGGDDEILTGSYNLIYNGSFEATDGTGAITVTTTPAGWTAGGVDCTDAYNVATDLTFGDGYEYECTDSGAGSSQITQAANNLAANQIYRVLARAKDDGTTVCTLDITGEGGAAFTAVSTTTDAWESLTGTFGTGAALDDVVLVLETVTATQVCLWDHITLYRIDDVATDRDEFSEPGVLRFRGEYAAGTGDLVCGTGYGAGNCDEAATGLFVTVTPMTAGGSLVLLDASIHYDRAGVGSGCQIRLRNTTSGITLDETDGGTKTTLHGSVLRQDPGSTMVYALQIREYPSGAGTCTLQNADADPNLDYDSWIEAILIPTR